MQEEHTAELKRSREEAERVAGQLQRQGWEISPERVPLQGQWGFYCVRTFQDSDGEFRTVTHSVRWNLFKNELQPVTVACRNDTDLLSFVWQHAAHEGFDYFEYGQDSGDVGFVCYCHAYAGTSLVLRLNSEIEDALSEAAFELLYAFDDE